MAAQAMAANLQATTGKENNMTNQVSKMHERGHFMIWVLTGLCGFMTTVMTAGLLWGASTLNAMQLNVVALQEQMKGFSNQVEMMRADMRDASSRTYTAEAAANDRKMYDLQFQMISNRISVLEGKKAETIRGIK